MASPEKSLSKKRGRPKGSKKKKATPRHMHIERADNGGFHVRHSYDSPAGGADASEPTPDTTHSLGDPSALLSHVQDNFGGQMPGAEAAGPGAAAAPAQGAQV